MPLPVPLAEGHDPEVVRGNIRALSERMPHPNACGVALQRARRWWEWQNPGQDLPPHLRKKTDENLALGSYEVSVDDYEVPLARARSAEAAHRAARRMDLIDAPVEVVEASDPEANRLVGGQRVVISATTVGQSVVLRPPQYPRLGNNFKLYTDAARPARYDRSVNGQIAPLAAAIGIFDRLRAAGFEVDASPELIEAAAAAASAPAPATEAKSALGTIEVRPAQTRAGERGVAFSQGGRLSDEGFKLYRELTKGVTVWDGGRNNIAALAAAPRIVKALSDAGFTVAVDPSLAEAMKSLTEHARDDVAAGKARAETLDARLRQGGLSLYDYQKEGIAWLSGKQTAMLFDDQGVGKTIQTLCALPPNAPVVVVSPASVKDEWRKEVERWRPEYRATVLDTKGTEPFRWPESNEIILTSYSNLPDENEYGPPLEGTVLVADEAQELKGDNNARVRRFTAMARAIRARDGRTWGLSGTPLENKAFELWNLLLIFGLADEAFGTKSAFARLMGGELVEGSGRVPTHWEFNDRPDTAAVVEKLQRVSLRREKAFALSFLPPKKYEEKRVELAAEDRAALDQELRESGIDVDSILDAIDRAQGDADELPQFQDMSRAREILARAKIPNLIEIVKKYEAQGEPIVVFSSHKAPIKALASRPGWAELSGDVSTRKQASDPKGRSKRSQIIDDFQEGKLKGIAATIRASGTGITLTRASTAIFLDQDWTPTRNIQAADRIHRIGQMREVQIKILVADHAIDTRVAEILERKRQLIADSVNATSRTKVIEEAPVDLDFDALAARYVAEVEADAERQRVREDVTRRREIEVEERAEGTRRQAETRPPRSDAERFAAQAMVTLAGLDPDRAAVRNDMGFDSASGRVGHALAGQVRSRGELTEDGWRLAKALARKFHRQVGEMPTEE